MRVTGSDAPDQKLESSFHASRVRADQRMDGYSTVTDLARLRGWSTSQPRRTAM
jgi:hypothetical protein